ncbi:hypothetical protein IWX47DRAFT_168606 [Phyllosticta citricarpa]
MSVGNRHGVDGQPASRLSCRCRRAGGREASASVPVAGAGVVHCPLPPQKATPWLAKQRSSVSFSAFASVVVVMVVAGAGSARGLITGLTRAAPVQPVLVAAARRDGASKVAVVEETDRHVRGAVAVASPASRFWSFTAFRHCDRRPGCGDSVLLCAVVCGGSKLTIRLGGGTAGQLPDCGAFKC